MKREITYFESVKQDNTIETFKLAEQKISETGVSKIVLASTTGRTALRAMEYFAGKGVKLIVVPHQYGFSSETNRFPAETVKTLRDNGHEVYFGTMLIHRRNFFLQSQSPIYSFHAEQEQDFLPAL